VLVRAKSSSGQTIENNAYETVIFGTEDWDAANAYNTGTGVFTAPSAGKYLKSRLLQGLRLVAAGLLAKLPHWLLEKTALINLTVRFGCRLRIQHTLLCQPRMLLIARQTTLLKLGFFKTVGPL